MNRRIFLSVLFFFLSFSLQRGAPSRAESALRRFIPPSRRCQRASVPLTSIWWVIVAQESLNHRLFTARPNVGVYRSVDASGAAPIARIGVGTAVGVRALVKWIQRTGAAKAGRCSLALFERREIAAHVIFSATTVTAVRIIYFSACRRCQLSGTSHRSQCPQGGDEPSHLSLHFFSHQMSTLLAETAFCGGLFPCATLAACQRVEYLLAGRDRERFNPQSHVIHQATWHRRSACRSVSASGAALIARIGVRAAAAVKGIQVTGAAKAGRCGLALFERREIASFFVSIAADATAIRIIYFGACRRYQLSDTCQGNQCP